VPPGSHATEQPWEIPGSAGRPVLGTCRRPDPDPAAESPLACVSIAHGFKGFMDYGMFPRIARELAAAGCLVHRFNFSHSGMTRQTERFARPDLFEADTWNRQVDDLGAIDAAIDDGRLAGAGRPRIWVGHSRGGVAVILAAGRGRLGRVDGIASIAAPAEACRLAEADRARLRREGFLPSPSSRTGQDLRVGRDWLEEIEADPVGHDPCVQIGRVSAPTLVIHGEADETVPVADAERLAAAAGGRCRLVRLPGANHVLGVVHPLAEDAPTPPPLRRAIDELRALVRAAAGAGD
jgi:pimeloyl-ACP methyl ester carboxylesterase